MDPWGKAFVVGSRCFVTIPFWGRGRGAAGVGDPELSPIADTAAGLQPHISGWFSGFGLQNAGSTLTCTAKVYRACVAHGYGSLEKCACRAPPLLRVRLKGLRSSFWVDIRQVQSGCMHRAMEVHGTYNWPTTLPLSQYNLSNST